MLRIRVAFLLPISLVALFVPVFTNAQVSIAPAVDSFGKVWLLAVADDSWNPGGGKRFLELGLYLFRTPGIIPPSIWRRHSCQA
jgi:hypothetical protein